MLTNALQIRQALLSSDPTLQFETAHALGHNAAHFAQELEGIESALKLDGFYQTLTEEAVFLLIESLTDHLGHFDTHTQEAQVDLLDRVEACWDQLNVWVHECSDNPELRHKTQFLCHHLSLYKEYGVRASRVSEIVQCLAGMSHGALQATLVQLQGIRGGVAVAA